MRDKLLWGSLIFLACYTIVPWIVTRMMGVGVFRRGRVRGQVAFTFDDGPDPEYTPQLLDMLKLQGVKASFFVLGSKAEKYPELIRRIHEEGHQIGIHNYTHLSNWLMWPWTVRLKQVNRSADIVERIIGVRPTYYRPPWGIINAFDFMLRDNYRIVLWSLMASDWSSSVGKSELKERLIQGIHDGAVVLLHDSGETFGADRDAPMHMLRALEEVLNEVKQRGLDCVRVDEMVDSQPVSPRMKLSRPKRVLVYVWMLWERMFIRMFDIAPVDHNNPFLRFRIREYTGSEPLTLTDGERIVKGDRVFELHLDNDTLFNLGMTSRNTTQLAIQMIRRMEQLLPQVNKLLNSDPNLRDVKGLYGISLINRGPQQLGFTVLDLPRGIFARLTRLYLRLLLYVIHPRGKERLRTKQELLVPKIVAISRKELMNRYIA